jgi:hypothetical protein
MERKISHFSTPFVKNFNSVSFHNFASLIEAVHMSMENIATSKGHSLANGNNETRPTNQFCVLFGTDCDRLEREADLHIKEAELNECLELVAQLVDLFRHKVILPAAQLECRWYDEQHQGLKCKRGNTGDHLFDVQVESMAVCYGLTKEQWQQLLYLHITAGDYLEISHVTRNHLKKVHQFAIRLLESEEQAAVFALIRAVETHLPSEYCLSK